MIEYSAGIVTAYGSAVRAGYTGTYEDFCRQQAQYAENALAVEQAKQDAQTAKDQAQTAKDDAVSAKNTAVTAKDDAVSAKNTAVSAKDDAVSAKNTATTKAQEASTSATSAGQSATNADQSARSAEQSAQDISENLEQIQTNKEDIGKLKADLGDLTDLETSDKSNLVAAINEVAQSGGGGGGGSSTLSGLTDTSISGKADGQVLTYDGTSNKWVNRAPSGGSTVTVDSALSATSTNPVQNKVIKQALNNKAGTAVATTSANGLMSATDKSHLDSVYADYSAAIAALGA
jgi:hypothetical protein